MATTYHNLSVGGGLKADSASIGGVNLYTSIPAHNLICNSEGRVWSNGEVGVRGDANGVGNGDCESVSGYMFGDCTVAVVAGGVGSTNCFELTRTGNSYQTIEQMNIPTTVGLFYKFAFYVKSGTSGNEALYYQVLNNDGSVSLAYSTATSSGIWTVYSVSFEAITSTSRFVVAKNTSTAGTMLFDEFSVHEAFPLCGNGTTDAADGHSKTSTLSASRHRNDDGTYGYSKYLFKLTKGADTAELYNFDRLAINYKSLAGRTISFGMVAYSTVASNLKLCINDGVTTEYTDAYIDATTLSWIELAVTISDSATMVTPSVYLDGSIGDTAYVSEIMLSPVQHLGTRNYAPIPNEKVFLETPRDIVGFAPTADHRTYYLATQSIGTLSPDTKGIGGVMWGKNSAADKQLFISSSSSSYNVLGYVHTQVANVRATGHFDGMLNGDGSYNVFATDANFDASNTVIRVLYVYL